MYLGEVSGVICLLTFYKAAGAFLLSYYIETKACDIAERGIADSFLMFKAIENRIGLSLLNT